MNIICDTAALIKPEEEATYGIKVIPLTVTIEGKTYKEFVDIDSDDFIKIIEEGNIPKSSQPTTWDIMEAFENCNGDTICITLADGMSGAYQTFMGIKGSMGEKGEKITVINSKTMAGPERQMVKKAVDLNNKGYSKDEIIAEINKMIDHSFSFLIPYDFDYLLRGGRLTPLAAKIGSLIRIVPVMKQTEGCTGIEKFAIKRTLKGAVKAICDEFKNMGVNKDYTIHIGHGCNEKLGLDIKNMVAEEFNDVEIVLSKLSPAFITQGGPNCISIQIISN